MKYIYKRVFAFLLVSALLAGAGIPALAADPVLAYTGNGGSLAITPGSVLSATDLFVDLKGVMPGDHITEQITIKNNANHRVYVRIYLRALGASAGSEDFLSQLTLQVQQVGKTNKLFEAPADQTAQLTDWVLLGTFLSGAEVKLDVTLDVPVTLGDEYQNAVGELTWEFRAEEYPLPNGPSTGDDTPLVLYAVLLGGGVLLLAVLLATRKRRESEE